MSKRLMPFRSIRNRQLEGTFQASADLELAVESAVAVAQAGNLALDAFDHLDIRTALSASRAFLRGGIVPGNGAGLYGMPIAAKALFTVDGMPTGAGTRLPISGHAPRQGPAIAALQSAGAIMIGKTRTTEFALGNANLIHPVPRNPLSRRDPLATGGSSSGSASAVAGGLVPIALGTDTGGSVRIPAALCGVVGYKSSQASLSCEGVFPLSPSFDSVGIIALSMSGVARTYTAITGHAPTSCVLSGLKIGICPALLDGLEPAVEQAWRSIMQILLDTGAVVSELELPGLERAAEIFSDVVPYELRSFLGADFLARYFSELDPVAQARLASSMVIEPAHIESLMLLRGRWAAQVKSNMRELDCWISPSVPCLPLPQRNLSDVPAIVHWNGVVSRQARPVNIYDQCAITLPFQTDGMALPTSLQIVAGSGLDSKLLGIAQAIEAFEA